MTTSGPAAQTLLQQEGVLGADRDDQRQAGSESGQQERQHPATV
jgi:hypothetical protein